VLIQESESGERNIRSFRLRSGDLMDLNGFDHGEDYDGSGE
jgi:hypothetical protein